MKHLQSTVPLITPEHVSTYIMKDTDLQRQLADWAKRLPNAYPYREFQRLFADEYRKVTVAHDSEYSSTEELRQRTFHLCALRNEARVLEIMETRCNQEAKPFMHSLKKKSAKECVECLLDARAVFEESVKEVAIEFNVPDRYKIAVVNSAEAGLMSWYSAKNSHFHELLIGLQAISEKRVNTDAFPPTCNEANLNQRRESMLSEMIAYSLQTSGTEAWPQALAQLCTNQVESWHSRVMADCTARGLTARMMEKVPRMLKGSHKIEEIEDRVKWAVQLTVKAAGWGSPSLEDNFALVFVPTNCDIESVRATLEGVLEECRNLLTFDEKVTLAIALFLWIGGFVPPLEYTYSASNRVLCLSVMQRFLGPLPASLFLSTAEHLFIDCESSHSLVSHIPARSLRQVSKLGQEEYQRQVEQSLAREYLNIFTGAAAALITSNPQWTHKPLKTKVKWLGGSGILSVLCLSMKSDSIVWEGMDSRYTNIYSLKYNFPSFSVLSGPAAALAKVKSVSYMAQQVLKGAASLGFASPLPQVSIGLEVIQAIPSNAAFALQFSDKLLKKFSSLKPIVQYVGEQLAKSICAESYGSGPVSLVGVFGSCLIVYYCLKELARHSSRQLVQDVVFIGLTDKRSAVRLKPKLAAVAGRVVNVHFTKKGAWMKRFSVCAGQVWCDGVENFYASWVGERENWVAEVLRRINLL